MKNIEKIKMAIGIKILIEGEDGFKATYTDPITRKQWYIIASWGMGWDHVSISSPSKTPDWDLMCHIKEIFFKPEEWAVEYHPAESDYVNNHEHCLHIWHPLDETIPTPPSILIGIKGMSSEETAEGVKSLVGSMSVEKQLEVAKEKYGFVPNRNERRAMDDGKQK
jgi:hypothetical protein